MSLITSGWLAKPAGSKLRLRRSTIILMVMFIGLGALYLQIRTSEGDDLPGTVVIVPSTIVTETTLATISP